MSILQTQRDKLREILNIGYCDADLPIPWNKATIDPELSALDASLDIIDVSINDVFSTDFKSATTDADRSLIVAALIVTRQLVRAPTHLAMARNMIGRIL